MTTLVLSFFCAFIVTFYAIPIIIKFAKNKNLYDKPNKRKIHKSRTPVLGGIAIFLGLIFSVSLWITTNEFADFPYLLAAIIVISLIGIRDDIVPLGAISKLLGQLIAAFIIVNLGDVRLTSLYGVFGIYDISLGFSYAISLFTIIVIINSFNLIDGVDGLASCLGITVMCIFGIWFYLVGNMSQAVLAFCFLGALSAFLKYNFYPAKIFMGDTGAMLLGVISAVFAIKFIEINSHLSITSIYKFKAGPAIVFGILLVPLYDTLRIFIIRGLMRKSPFTSDTNHIHHMLMKLGMSHVQVVLLLWGLNIFFIIFAVSFQYIRSFVLILLMLLIAYILNILLNIFLLKKYSEKHSLKSLAIRIFFL